MDIVKLGKAVQQLCETKTFYMVLNAISGFEAFGACDGGCLMVARALLQVGIPGTLYSIWGKRRPPFGVKDTATMIRYRPHWQHAMIKVGPNSYLDGDGLKTECQVYEWWSASFQVTALRPTTPHWERIIDAYDTMGKEVPYDQRVVDNLARYFATALDRRGILT